MECIRVSKLPEGKDWLYEIKQDGYRAIAVIDHGAALLYSISGREYTAEFPQIGFSLRELGESELVLDGEIVALDAQGRARFQELQNRKNTTLPIVYYVFDVLHRNGKDMLALTLARRKEVLDEIAPRFADPLRVNPVFRTRLSPLVAQVKKLDLEGIVAKRAGSLYLPGKTSDAWQKHRFNDEGEFVIGGYVRGGHNFSSLVVGEYRDKDLYYVKRVAAGFTAHLREEVYSALRSLETRKCPFVNLPEPGRSGHGLTAEKMRECVWLKPERRCELEFVERTASGRLRHAAFRRLVS
jgi:bifunctional non-homologous end joining protein LigD